MAERLGNDANGNHTHSPTVTYQQIITDFLYSSESLNRLLKGYYPVYLQRLADSNGLNAWLTYLEQGRIVLPSAKALCPDEFFNK